jgi:hypothetical protein
MVNNWCVVEEGCAESGPELNVFKVKHIACLSPVIRIQEDYHIIINSKSLVWLRSTSSG